MLGRDAAKYVESAKLAWEQAAPIHWRTTNRLLEAIRPDDALFMHDIQINELRRIGINGSDVAQLNCNNGVELITIKRLGSGRSTGFDISAGFINQAKQLAEVAGTSCEFVCSDVYKIPEIYNHNYNIVVVTAGALCFMPDLTEYFAVAKRLLRRGGRITLYECHPITRMFALDREIKDLPHTESAQAQRMVYSYFDEDPIPREVGLDYPGGTTYDSSPVFYFRHKLSDIIMALINAGFNIEKFQEHDKDPSQSITRFESAEVKPPLSFVLTGTLAA